MLCGCGYVENRPDHLKLNPAKINKKTNEYYDMVSKITYDIWRKQELRKFEEWYVGKYGDK